MCYNFIGDKMKIVLKILLGIVACLYVTVAVFLTVCLLNLNKYNLSEFETKTYVITEDDALKPDYEKNSLIVVKTNELDTIVKGDKIFFYNTYAHEVSVSYALVTKVEKISEDETTFTLEGDKPISDDFVIGKASTAKEYKSVGKVLKVLESKWGFLFCIVLPVLFVFIYEIYAVIREIRHPKKK